MTRAITQCVTACSLRKEEFDVLVIGGGCVGAGVAWEAATRGLKVALVERDDFAAGEPGRDYGYARRRCVLAQRVTCPHGVCLHVTRRRSPRVAGTSGRSTKLIHGGIRYLESAVFNLDWGMYKLVQEALSEVRFLRV